MPPPGMAPPGYGRPPGPGMPPPGSIPQQGRARDPFGLAPMQPQPGVRSRGPGYPEQISVDESIQGARGRSDGGEAALRDALSKASREVIEKIAWEVVPQLAETIIREELDRLIKDRETKN